VQAQLPLALHLAAKTTASLMLLVLVLLLLGVHHML
jgi:hypothetical protein